MIGVRVHILKFDVSPLRRALGQATVERLMKIGAYVRRDARTRLRYRRGRSRPGEPPNVHRSDRQPTSPLRERLLFALPDESRVIIGPALAPGKAGTAARALEMGGTSITADGERIHIKPRPFMKPAFDAVAMKAPAFWADSLR